MHMKKNFIWGLLLAACLFSCQNKYEHLDEFKEFVEKIEDECDDYTLNDWEKADKEFSRLTRHAEDWLEELSVEERLKVAKYQATYAAMKAKAEVEKLGKSLKESGRQLKEAIEDED